MNAPASRETTGLEIASRVIKVIQFIGTLLIWLLYALGAYSVYALWTLDRTSTYFRSSVQSQLELGWIAIGLIVFLRLIQIAVGWAILVPIEARIQGLNIRDPEVASTLRTQSAIYLVLEAVSLAVVIAVPILIAHFRYGHFN